MKKLLIIVYLIFSLFFISSDIFTGFNQTKGLYYSCFDYSKNFEIKKFYIINSYSDVVNEHVTAKGIQIITGYLEDKPYKVRKLRLPYKILGKEKKEKKNNKKYFEAWYNKKIDKIIIKTDKTKGLSFRKMFIHLFFYLGFIPAIVYFKKLKNE